MLCGQERATPPFRQVPRSAGLSVHVLRTPLTRPIPPPPPPPPDAPAHPPQPQGPPLLSLLSPDCPVPSPQSALRASVAVVLDVHTCVRQARALTCCCVELALGLGQGASVREVPFAIQLPPFLNPDIPRNRALPPVRWLFDLYCARVLRERSPGNQPNPLPPKTFGPGLCLVAG